MGRDGLAYIRETYGVPAYRGMPVRLRRAGDEPETGVITGAHGPHLAVRMDTVPARSRRRAYLHPTWQLDYWVFGGWVAGG